MEMVFCFVSSWWHLFLSAWFFIFFFSFLLHIIRVITSSPHSLDNYCFSHFFFFFSFSIRNVLDTKHLALLIPRDVCHGQVIYPLYDSLHNVHVCVQYCTACSKQNCQLMGISPLLIFRKTFPKQDRRSRNSPKKFVDKSGTLNWYDT